ncbi:hypothetical protein KIW84_033072 [Lathyrus oleraceus]|uniref:Retrotransposon Copia-like N-terminal domain-containing protein n=1 Tax=Pisum sativum TaxID=3888 RepID=A0A9D4XUT9_PEA|nr:hypothetical protein KIW84_033072 [Pisum sativum]
MSKEISASVLYAAEISKKLQNRFQQKNGPRLFQLKKDLLNYVQDSSNVSSRSNPSHPLPSINVVLSTVTQDKKQREATTTLNPTKTPITCVAQDNNSKIFKKDRSICAHCGVVGHLKEKCFKLHVYPPGYKKPQSFKASNQGNNVIDHGNASNESLSDMTSQGYHQLISFLQAQMSKAGAFETRASINSVIAPNNNSNLKELMEFNTNSHLPIKLNGTNYPAWYKQCNALLIARDLEGYVTGTKKCPPATIVTGETTSPNPDGSGKIN